VKLEKAIADYLEFLEYEQQGSPHTISLRYYTLGSLRRYMEEELGIKELEEIQLLHLRAFLAHLRKDLHYQPVSLAGVIYTLRAFYSFAAGRGLVEENIARRLKKPRLEQKEIEHLTWEEVEALFLAVPPGPTYLRDLLILLLFYYCGLRLDELHNLKPGHFSEDLSELHIEKSKSGKFRILPVHPFLRKVLARYLQENFSGHGASPYLFPGRGGSSALIKDRIYVIVKKIGKRAGIQKRVTPHVLRHTFATHLHQKGVDIYRLAQLLGHANIEKTMIYTHLEDEELSRAVMKLKEERAKWKTE